MVHHSLSILLCCLPLFLYSEPIRLYFQELHTENGIISTDKGGLLFTDQLQVQAQSMRYNEKEKILEAYGELLFFLNGHPYTANSLYLDLNKESGWFEQFQTKIGSFYCKTDRIGLDAKKDLFFEQCEITPFETAPLLFSFHAQKGGITQNRHLYTKALSAQLFSAPLLYIPHLEWDLDNLPSSSIRYKVQYNSGQAPLVSLRYPLIAEKNQDTRLRLDYRITKGVSGAIESKGNFNHNHIHYWSKNYVSYDTFYNDNNPNALNWRYRLLGKWTTQPENKELSAYLQYDINSDRDLRQNFSSAPFELSDVRRTQAVFGYNPEFGQNFLTFRPQVNTYESMRQMLPTLTVRLNPIRFQNLPFLFDNNFSVGYSRYSYSNQLDNTVQPFAAARLETKQKVDFPLQIGFLKLEPDALFHAIYYSNSPSTRPNTLAYLRYGAQASTLIEGEFSDAKHTLQPYVNFHAIVAPTLPPPNHYIFSLDDGIYQIQELKTGVLNTLFFSPWDLLCSWDLFGLNYFSQNIFQVPFPKVQSELLFTTPYMRFKNSFGYNFQENSIDFLNFAWATTFSKTFAFHLDWLYRGDFYWKKSDRDNYQLDLFYPIHTLRNTPLSDKRATLISRFEWHFIPNWTLKFQHHNGFWRAGTPPYFEYQAELSTIYHSKLDIRLSLTRSVNDTQVLCSLHLI